MGNWILQLICTSVFFLLPQFAPAMDNCRGNLFINVMMQNFQLNTPNAQYQLFITSYQDDTNVSVTIREDSFRRYYSMTRGMTISVELPSSIELIGTGKSNKVVTVKSNKSITVLAFSRKRRSSDTTIVYPETSLGTEYWLVTPELGPPDTFKEFAIIAGTKSTSADIHIKGRITFEGLAYEPNTVLTLTLEEGQAVQLQSQDDLTGTKIVSTQPVAVLTGHTCAWKYTRCDHANEQLLPVSGWGNIYIVAPLSFQSKSDIIYAVANTKTRVDYSVGVVKYTANLNPGETLKIENRNYPVSIKADARIQVMLFCTGGRTSNLEYDTFLMNIISLNAYCRSYFVYGKEDFINYVVIIIKTSGTAKVTFDKKPIPNVNWTAITETDYSYAEHIFEDSKIAHLVEHPSEPFGLQSVGIASHMAYGSPGTCTETTCDYINCAQNDTCKMVDGEPQCIDNTISTCSIAGNIHYKTFDGVTYDVQGTCSYTIAKSCETNSQSSSFNIEVENRYKDNGMTSHVSVVKVQVYQHNITILVSDIGRVRVNGIISSLPITLTGNQIQIYQSGGYVVIDATFGLKVFYDWINNLQVELRINYKESVCGMCGNNNKVFSDDFTTPAGTLAQNSKEFAKSWKVDGDQPCQDDCKGPCKDCPPFLTDRYKSEDFCGLIAKRDYGPFSQCHTKIDPRNYLDNCVYDVCLNNEDKQTVCQSIKTYANACQREGVKIDYWRKSAECSLECGPNSQYKLCGPACPNTCEDDTAAAKCRDQCVEGCECNTGFVQTIGKCVPKSTCGCTYKGLRFSKNQVFWDGENCERQCTCNPTTKQVECKESKCKALEKCSVLKDLRSCRPISYGTCVTSANLHFSTFDKYRFDFQGSCVYQFSGLCNQSTNLADFQVNVQSHRKGINGITFIEGVELLFNGQEIKINRKHEGLVMLNSQYVNLPYHSNDKRIELYKRGSDVLIQTDAGIKLTYDWQSRITLTLPVKYAGSVCGLCGDFNGIKTNEQTLPNGGNTQSPGAFGDSWKVINIPGCQLSTPAPICPRLQTLKEQQRASGTDCGVIITKDGPFRDCHSKVDPEGFFEDCVYDFCSYKGRQTIFCQTLSSYAAICQLAGATLYPWRMKEFCPMSCPKNSHYEVCSIGCPTTCTGIPSTSGCDPACKEGCTCNAGYVLSGDQCVDLKHCGCVYQGNYYKKDEVFYPNGKCDQKCTCNEGRFVICTPFSCGTNEKCTLVDGTKRCYPVGPGAICSASSPHYQSFDGFLYDFQGNCTYILAKTCGQSRKYTYFEITVKNEQWGNARVTVPTLVTLKVFNHTVTINHQKTGVIQVNGVEYILPASLLNGQLKVYMHGTVCIIETDFELTVNYDWGHQVLILVPQNYKGKMCGLCGNFNGNSTEIFLLPEGQLSTDFNEFVSAWTVPSKEKCTPVICGDVEFPCSTCNGKKIHGFEKKESCGFLLETEGPLSKCHGRINAHVYFKNCVHDMCTNDSDLKVLCQNIKNYVMECQAAGVTIRPWRNTSFCGIDCPANSTYKICSHLCDATCAGLVEPWHCSEVCAEGCECDEDYFFDGQQCVTMDRCGCYENGTYYPLEVAVLSDDCAQSCTCRPTGLLICEDHKCKGDDECTTKDGVMNCTKPDACKSTKCRVKEECVNIDGKAHCIPQFTSSFWAWGDPHYRTLDGMEFDFEGTCTYTIAKYCGNDTALVPFNIEAKNDNRGEKPAISYVRSVALYMYSMNISINRSDFPKIRINDIFSNLPANINAGAIRAFQSGFTAVIKTDNGIELSYDWNAHLMVTLPSSYYGTTCGLSGNFNQDAADDTADPNGKQVKDIVKWAGSWKVNDSDLTCRNLCPGSCPTCDESKKNRYRSNQFCGLISDDVEGPFRECHSTVIPDKFYDNCLHDVCMNDGANVILCQALRSYASICLKKNARIHDWRTPSNCSLICPVNSHYEACGNACPASCMDKSAPDRCTDPCTETCQCDAGFFLSGEECVAVENCGCSFKGNYYKPDQEFWESENCERHCRCDPILGIVECQTTKCKDNLECKVMNGTRGCFLISNATCSAWGDSHYITFDGKYFEFMSDCMYQLVGVISKNPTLTPFIVMVRNDHQGNKTISNFKEVTVKVYGLNVSLSMNYPGRIQVDEVETLLPFHSTKNNINAFISGNKVVIKTKLGMTVAFNWDNHVSVTIPISYSKAVSGLCGDRNGDPSDDLTMKDGSAADNAAQFAESWKVSDAPACTTKCSGNCSRCSQAEEQANKTEEYCGFITQVNGSFSNCHKRIDPTPYFASCVLDTCKNEGHQPILCSAIKTYVIACQAKGIEIKEWRTSQFCSLVCSGNSHYELCGTGCPATCYGLASPDPCDEECSEGCFCNNGFLLSGDKCVPLKDCGCPYMGRYYQTGQKFYMGNLCHERCRCTENGFVVCSKTSCGANEDCRVLNGVRGCYPSAYGRCVTAGGRHYLSFDNQSFDIRGSCTYTLATICGNRLENFFSVVVNNQCSDGSNVTTSKMVIVSVNHQNISLQQGTSWKAKVNQEQYNLPAILDGGHVVINQEGKNIILRTYFGLEVLYDSMFYVQVTVPSTYKNHMCGLCGNFNGDPSDDYMMPSGKTGSSVDEFSAAWKVAMKDSLCHDSCRSIYPVCNEQTTNAFKGDTQCGLIMVTDGPFKNCHTVVNPTNFLNYCLYKMCVLSGNQNTLCSSLQAYAVACQYAGAVIQAWRETVSCDLRCSANSHYEVCTKTCESSCASVLGSTYCTEKCYEGCECDPGYVFDGEDCVPRNACGCLYKTRYLKATENLITPMCVRQCSCGLDGDTICIPFTCAPDQGCGHRNNVIGCYRLEASCTISNGVDFISFDNKKNKMASPGAFEMAFLCDNASSDWFRVVVEIHQCNPTLATVVAYIFFRNVFIAVNSKKEAWLTGNRLLIPAIVNNVISVFKWKQNVIIEAKGKVRVIIGTNRELTVQVWEVYAGQVCGACGNFNENPDDDPQISGGGQASETSEMIHSWRGHNFSGCGD